VPVLVDHKTVSDSKIYIKHNFLNFILKLSHKLSLLALVVCAVALIPLLGSADAKTQDTTYTVKFLGLNATNSPEDTPNGMAWKPDGSKLFLVGEEGNDFIHEYACSVKFDPNTCLFDSKQSIKTQSVNPTDIEFSSNGTIVYVLAADKKKIFQWSMGAAYDISNSFTYKNASASINSQESVPEGLAFNSAGTKMFVVGTNGDSIDEWTLGATPWNVTRTVTHTSATALGDAEPTGLAWSTDGKILYVVGSGSDVVREFKCATFDASTCVFQDSISVAAQEATASDVTLDNRGQKMFVLGDTGNGIDVYSLPALCPWDLNCTVTTFVTDDGGEEDRMRGLLAENMEAPELTEGILIDLEPANRTVDTTAAMPLVKLEPGDSITITLNVHDDLGPEHISQVSMYTNYGEKPSDMNLFYANNFNDKNEISQSFYHWYQNDRADVAYGYDDTVQWKHVSGYTTNADYAELTKDRISISVGEDQHPTHLSSGESNEDRLVVSFTATFNEMMSEDIVKVKLADHYGLYDIVTLPFTIQVGNPDATFEDVMGKNPGYKFIPMLDASETLVSIQQWVDPSSEMTDEEFVQLLGIQETELPAWVKDNLAQWVVEDKIDLAVMIIAVEHLMNLQ